MTVDVSGSCIGRRGCVSDFLFDFEKLFDALIMLELLLNFEHLAMQFGVLELSPIVDGESIVRDACRRHDHLSTRDRWFITRGRQERWGAYLLELTV